ncbi:MAG: hypothetical protein ACLP1X_17365 [Polyangiaceae bacterium]|jgi:hypothetical protein
MDDDELMGASEVAEDEGLPVEEVRAWAAENEVQRVGNVFVFTAADREALRDDLDADEEEDEGGDEEDDEEEDGDAGDD